jgi:DNA invertase Pin-like site-specific DNA recombinase
VIAPRQGPDRKHDVADDTVRHAFAGIEVIADPQEALRRIALVRETLDDLERIQVTRALETGASLAAIGRDLGISRQSVHRRYGDLRAAAERRPGDHPDR